MILFRISQFTFESYFICLALRFIILILPHSLIPIFLLRLLYQLDSFISLSNHKFQLRTIHNSRFILGSQTIFPFPKLNLYLTRFFFSSTQIWVMFHILHNSCLKSYSMYLPMRFNHLKFLWPHFMFTQIHREWFHQIRKPFAWFPLLSLYMYILINYI